MNPVVHFEMPYEDQARITDFYRRAFDWELAALGAEMGDYVIATTAPTAAGRPTQPGTINGGFFKKNPAWPLQFPSVVIAVEDITAAMGKVKDAGGTLLGEPMAIPGVGQYVSFVDSEGNRVSMLQPIPPGSHG
ncbi:VOC family protein [Massilia sp. TS11]|uniref:VOC family protein n=1 Tax=Massilia sp. TS11 TaxID=2908003 RepID=UPI001EDC0939|nr:VOC family protein [Massilia sp. TS11]MCG2585997.1 hypothetical protein [Massilia sp. TS11]